MLHVFSYVWIPVLNLSIQPEVPKEARKVGKNLCRRGRSSSRNGIVGKMKGGFKIGRGQGNREGERIIIKMFEKSTRQHYLINLFNHICVHMCVNFLFI